MFRSSLPEVFHKKSVLRNFTKFTGKQIKKETLVQVLSVNFVKFLVTPFIIEHLWWLLLNVALTNKHMEQLMRKNWPKKKKMKLTFTSFPKCKFWNLNLKEIRFSNFQKMQISFLKKLIFLIILSIHGLSFNFEIKFQFWNGASISKWNTNLKFKLQFWNEALILKSSFHFWNQASI